MKAGEDSSSASRRETREQEDFNDIVFLEGPFVFPIRARGHLYSEGDPEVLSAGYSQRFLSEPRDTTTAEGRRVCERWTYLLNPSAHTITCYGIRCETPQAGPDETTTFVPRFSQSTVRYEINALDPQYPEYGPCELTIYSIAPASHQDEDPCTP